MANISFQFFFLFAFARLCFAFFFSCFFFLHHTCDVDLDCVDLLNSCETDIYTYLVKDWAKKDVKENDRQQQRQCVQIDNLWCMQCKRHILCKHTYWKYFLDYFLRNARTSCWRVRNEEQRRWNNVHYSHSHLWIHITHTYTQCTANVHKQDMALWKNIL